MPTDDPYWNEFREDADTFRRQRWDLRPFQSGPALYSLDGTVSQRYDGEPFDPTKWEVREASWDHEHCHFCMATISDIPVDYLKAGYTNGENWLCTSCYRRIIEAGEDPERVIVESGE